MTFRYLIANNARFGCCQCASYVYFLIEVLHDRLFFSIFLAFIESDISFFSAIYIFRAHFIICKFGVILIHFPSLQTDE